MNGWEFAALVISFVAAIYNAVLFKRGVGTDRFGIVNLALLTINVGLAVRGAIHR